MISLNIGKVVGRVDEGYWSQVHDFSPNEEQKFAIRGRLLAIVTLKRQDEDTDITVVERGREILAHLHELYFGNLEDSAYERLKQAVGTLSTTYEVWLDCAVILEDIIYLVSNSGGVWLSYKEQAGWLIEYPHNQIISLSGRLVPNQQFILGNRQFWQETPMGIVRAALESSLDQALETLGALVHGSLKAEGAAAILINTTTGFEDMKLVTRKEEEVLEDFSPPKIEHDFYKKPIFTQHGPISSKKNMILGISFLVAFILLAVVGKVRYQYLVSGKAKLDQRSEELAFKFNEARALSILNSVRSREMLLEVKTEMTDIRSLGGGKYKNLNLEQIEADYSTVVNKAMGINSILTTEVLDLSLIRDGLTGDKMTLLDGKLYVIDSTSDRLVSVDPVKKSGTVIAGKDILGEAKFIASYPGKIEIFSDKGVIECLVSGVQCSVKIKFDQDWGEIKDMAMFTGNIYLLSDKKIWRHQTAESGFGNKQSWVDLTAGDFLAIDGNVWVTRGGELLKYIRGNKENFAISGLDKPLGSHLQIYTNDEAEKLYVLDLDNSRLVSLKKTGEYLSQYLNSDLGKVTSVVVDEKQNKAYFVTGSKILQIEL
ncbi:MAG: hypothetical protein AAB550_02465 [Patescibacteria group bacterium]